MTFRVNDTEYGVLDLKVSKDMKERRREELVLHDTEVEIAAELANSVTKMPFDPTEEYCVTIGDKEFDNMQFVHKERKRVTFWRHEREIRHA